MGRRARIIATLVVFGLLVSAGILSYFLIFNKSHRNPEQICQRGTSYNNLLRDHEKYAVGQIPYESKNDNGDQVLTIPIVPAKGINLEPQLGLEYRSSLASLNSEVGVSWTLKGLSEISRCYKTIAHDKKFDNIKFSYEDVFCLDGQRMILVGGTDGYGSNSSEYRQELDGQNRIRAFDKQGNGPKYFIVNTKDNKILTFNSSSALYKDNTPMKWLLTKVQDYSGNTLEYFYQTEDQFSYLNRIAYANKEILFEYESRSDTQMKYYTHFLLSHLKKRLKSILVKAVDDSTNKLSRRYVLNYKTYGAGLLSLIDSVQVCFADQCLRPLEFEYNNYDDVLSFNDNKVIRHSDICGPVTKECNVKQMADMNGDGLTDLIAFGDDGVYVSINKGAGEFEFPKLWTSSFSKTTGGWSISNHIRVAIDVNDDRLPDIVGFYNNGIYVALNENGIKFDTMKIWLAGEFGQEAGSGDWNVAGDLRMFSDMNGDGLPDIIGFHRSKGLQISFNDGSKFRSAELYSSKFNLLGGYLPLVSIDDIDGDGFMNFIFSDARYVSPGTFYSKNANYTALKVNPRLSNSTFDLSGSRDNKYFRAFADINGDNLPDLVGIWENAVIVGQNEPVGEDQYKIDKIGERVLTSGPSNYKHRQLADINGDGLFDIVIFQCDGVYVSLGNGKGEFSLATRWSNKIESLPCTNTFDQTNVKLVSDINGDGIPDALSFESTGTILKAVLNPNGMVLLKSVNDSLGNFISYFYDTFVNRTIYNDNSSETQASTEYTKYNVNRRVVSRVISETDSCPNVDTPIITQNIEYKYGTYECHNVVGRNGCKFRWLETRDLVENKRKRIEFHTRFPLSGQIKTEISYDSQNKIIEYKSNTYNMYTRQSSFDKLPMYHLLLNDSRIENYDNDKTNRLLFTKSISYRYDEYDNMNRMLETTTIESSMLSEETLLSLNNDESNWFIGQVQEERKVHTLKDNSWSSTKTVQTNYVYDKKTRLLSSKTTHPYERNLAIEERYNHDNYGNVILLLRREESSGTERIDKFVYSRNGVNQITHYNALNQYESYEYDLMDRLVTINDTNGLTIKREFDVMGNKVREKSKDDSVTVWKYLWDFSLENSVYRVEQLQSSPDETTLRETIFYDSMTRQVRKVRKGFKYENIVEDYHYNKEHLMDRVSLKYKESVENPIYVYIEYDNRRREVARREPRSEKGDYITTTTEYNGLRSTKIDKLGYMRIEERNLQGKIVLVEDSIGSKASYKYDALGNVVQIVDAQNAKTIMDYDLNGKQLKIEEPSFGIVQFEYNAFGELIRKVDSNKNTFLYEFDAFGRLAKRVEREGETEWIYDKSLNGIGKLAYVTFKPKDFADVGSYNISYAYDSYSREVEELRTVTDTDGKLETFLIRKTFDDNSRIKSQTYPHQNFTMHFCYNKFGYLTGTSMLDDKCISSYLWKSSDYDASGQILQESFANNKIRQDYSYDQASYLLKKINARDNYNRVLRQVEYEYDNSKNLAKRVDFGLDEHFSSMNTYTYDKLDRIISTTSYKTPTQIDTSKSFTYDEMGNMLSYNNRIYQYNSQRPQRAISIGDLNITYDSMGNVQDTSEYQVEWYSYLKAKLIRNGTTGSQIEFRYGPNYERTMKIVRNKNKIPETVTHYIDNMYEKVVSLSKNETVHKFYLTINEKIVATHIIIETKEANKVENATFYMLTDNAGSIDAVLDETGSILVSYKYEAFGQRQVSYYNTSMNKFTELLNRGYTSHEYIDESRLINMNGRIFDSTHLRFLSPDMNVQDIYNIQNLNRYIYCLNNPFKYKDPSGYFFKTLFKFIVTLAVGIFTFGQMTTVALALTAGIQSTALHSVVYYSILGASTGFTTTFTVTGGNLKASLQGALWGGIAGSISGTLAYASQLSNPGLFDIRKFSMETVTNGLINKANDRDFLDGIHMHIFSYVANSFYNEFTNNGDGAEIRTGDPVAEKNYNDPPVWKRNNWGTQGSSVDKNAKVAYGPNDLRWNSLHEGGRISVFVEKYVPGQNGISFLHDMINYKVPAAVRESSIGNYGTMPIAAFVTFSAQYNQIECPYCFDKKKNKYF